MRYSSVEWTAVRPRRARRRLALLPWHRWRRPALLRMTLPVPVILNRLATDFFVLMPLGRRINSVSFQKSAQSRFRPVPVQALISAICFVILNGALRLRVQRLHFGPVFGA